MNVYMVTNGYHGCCYPRMMLPAFHNGFTLDRQGRDYPLDAVEKVKFDLDSADIVVFHRPEDPTYLKLAKMLKKDGKKIVMDNDDTFKISYHPLANFEPDATKTNLVKRGDAIDNFLAIADLVTTTTKTLANEYKKINDNVVILPNCVDPMDWDEPLRNESDKVRIGLVGSAALEYDYKKIKGVIRELNDRKDVTLFMFGLGGKEHRNNNPRVVKIFKEDYKFWDSLNIEHEPWCTISDYPQKLNEARLDMMLIPRKDNYFNKCKSNIKFLEASMCEIPVIAQSFKDGPYEEITKKTGILIKNDNDWFSACETLISNKDIRRNLGKAAKEYALNNFNIEVRAPIWENAYRKLYET